jgi:hypothetical protein
MTKEKDLLATLSYCGLSTNTCTMYKTYANTIMKHFETDNIRTVMKNADKSIAWIRKDYGNSDASKKNMIAAILAIYKHNKELMADTAMQKAHEKWTSAYEDLKERIDERYKTNKPSDKQADGFVPFSEIVKMRDSLEKGSEERLLLAMYTHIRPLRGDFNMIRIYTVSRLPLELSPNYIHITAHGAVLVLNEYKTAKSKGEFKKVLPSLLVAEIKESLKKRPRDWLFVKTDGTPYELANSYVRWANNTLKRIFGRGLTLSLVRHSYISSLDFNNLSIAEKEEIADDMAHTVGMQDKYRFVFKDK